MDFFTASIIAFFLMVSGGMVKGYYEHKNHPMNNKIDFMEVKTFKSKISGKDIKVIHYPKLNIYKVLDDELIEEFTEFKENEFFRYYDKTVQALNLKTANGSLLQFKSK